MLESSKYPLKSLYIYLSGSCNLACRHCWIEPSGEDKLSFPNFEDLKVAISDARNLGLRGVKLTGGEPLMVPYFFQLIDWLAAEDVSFSLETNGTLLNSEAVRKLKEAGVSRVSVSLDGPTAKDHDFFRGKEGAFEAARQGILKASAENIKLEIVFSLWKKNLPLLRETVLLAREIGAVCFKINIISEYRRASLMKEKGELPEIKEILFLRDSARQVGQEAGIPVLLDLPPAFLLPSEVFAGGFCSIKNILGITSKGDFSLCGIGELESESCFGNISERNIEEVWRESSLLKEVRERLPASLEGICARCFYRDLCLGKCRAVSLAGSGDIYSPFPFCSQAFEEGLFPKNLVI
ncbi:MAG: radical SAM protein [Elusimicrobia bacterium]|nr:radical SAM protein [Elusimicrobiota bacterium]